MSSSKVNSTSNAIDNADLPEKIRAACIQAALDGYENAAISGLCAEGAFEAAISAIRMLDVDAVADNKTEPES